MVSSSGVLRLRMCAQTTVMSVRRKQGRIVPREMRARSVYFWRRANCMAVNTNSVYSAKLETYLWNNRNNEKDCRQHQRHNRRSNEGLCAMCIEMLTPQGSPPRVGQPLFIVNIESMCRSSQYSNAEDKDKTSDDGLSQVKRCRVDLHLAVLLLSRRFKCMDRNGMRVRIDRWQMSTRSTKPCR